MALIEASSLSFSWGAERHARPAASPAVDGLELSIGEGEYLAVVGRNGSGKSTLLRLLAGLLEPGAGSVKVEGLEASDRANRFRVRSALSLVFQSPPDQIVASVVEEDVAFGPENLGLPREEIARRVEEALEAVGLAEERRRPSFRLSSGQMQRLALAGALAMRPRCIAFDEATSMLDPPSRALLLDLMDSLNASGMTIVHVTHDLSEAARAARVVALEGGRMVWDGPSAAFLEPEGPGLPAPAERLGLGLHEAGRAARLLGLEPRAREDAASLAARYAARREPGPLPAAPSRAAAAPASGPDPAPAKPGPAAPMLLAEGAAEPGYELSGVDFTRLRGSINEVRALEGVELRLERGLRLALVGHTGSGKSSLLEVMAAIALPEKGRLRLLGVDPAAKEADLAALRLRSPLAIQNPESALFEAHAGDDVAFGPRNQGLAGKELVARVRRWMDAVGLPFAEFRDRPVRSLSGGEKRRLALAGVLALESEALLLDEPTQALDPPTREAVCELLCGLGLQGRTLAIATHSMEEAATADLVAVMRGGRIAAFGPPSSLFWEDYDPDWGVSRPFAVELAQALRRAGIEVSGRPLRLEDLAALLAPAEGAA